ncbi:DUF2635 domain-containing protein [Escherichia coli]|nr:DUF2635 domain-containing protein [Escherichia coli]
MTTIFIKPAPGCLIRDPDTMTPLSQDGEEKPFTPFWCRRLNDGDVIVVDKTAEPARLPQLLIPARRQNQRER